MCGGRSGDKKTRWESESPMVYGCHRNRPMPARPPARSSQRGILYSSLCEFVTCEYGYLFDRPFDRINMNIYLDSYLDIRNFFWI